MEKILSKRGFRKINAKVFCTHYETGRKLMVKGVRLYEFRKGLIQNIEDKGVLNIGTGPI